MDGERERQSNRSCTEIWIESHKHAIANARTHSPQQYTLVARRTRALIYATGE